MDNNFEISTNPLLPNCKAVLLKEQVDNRGQIGGSVYILDNNDPCEDVHCDLTYSCVEDCSRSPGYYQCE